MELVNNRKKYTVGTPKNGVKKRPSWRKSIYLSVSQPCQLEDGWSMTFEYKCFYGKKKRTQMII